MTIHEQSIAQAIGISEGLNPISESTLSAMPLSDQIIGWSDMNTLFLRDITPETALGQQWYSAYIRSDLTVQAEIRRLGFVTDWVENMDEAYTLLEPLL